ncbi:transposase family protein, partial [Escherichia coli MP021552.11]
LTNSCGSRACPSCGKKATDLWIATQLNRLPDCDRVHLVFTLPDTLWPVFESNRWLLNDVCRLAVENLLYAARKRGLEPGIFCAIHTYGRRLNWHPHQASSHRQITGLHRGTQKYTCFHSSGGIILRDKYQ